jgi:predicted RNase H-like HicB family nuclease
MTEKEAIKNLKEIIDLSKEEIENNDENTTAILDITDLKSLAIVLKVLEKKIK